MKNKCLKKALSYAFALVFWLFIWEILAKRTNSLLILPAPKVVLKRLLELAGTSEFYRVLALSFLRVAWGFTVGCTLGFTLGVCSHILPFIRVLLDPIMSVLRATPVASFILVVLFWTDIATVPKIISLVMVLPILYQSTLLGFSQRDKGLSEMAKVYRLSPATVFFKVDLPQVMPSVLSSAKTALGLAWKAGIAAEVLALPKQSVGYMIYNAKVYLESADLYAWTLAIIIFSILLEMVMETATKRRGRDADGTKSF